MQVRRISFIVIKSQCSDIEEKYIFIQNFFFCRRNNLCIIFSFFFHTVYLYKLHLLSFLYFLGRLSQILKLDAQIFSFCIIFYCIFLFKKTYIVVCLCMCESIRVHTSMCYVCDKQIQADTSIRIWLVRFLV